MLMKKAVSTTKCKRPRAR
uniref:Uncharacterized protein n=1 Tax=Macrostomum lignano TaxID=282301 RepID=A0A1I8HWZ8_9PLAT